MHGAVHDAMSNTNRTMLVAWVDVTRVESLIVWTTSDVQVGEAITSR